MNDFYRLKVAGLERDLPICKVNDDIYIAGFIMLGDFELTVKCAEKLLKSAPSYDILITAEAKGIPLAHEMARQSGNRRYIVVRKAQKLYMKRPISTTVNSITTAKTQTLYIDQADADYMQGKNVLIVDDVISTGESIKAIELLVKSAGGNIAGKMAVLAEGEAANRKDITFLQYLPLFNNLGLPM